MFSELVDRIAEAGDSELDSLLRQRDERPPALSAEEALLLTEADRLEYDEFRLLTRWRELITDFDGGWSAHEAVMLQSHRCIHPGCRVRVGNCEADHLDEFAAGGATRPDNGAPMCRHHNLRKNLGYTTQRDGTGHWRTFRPDGTEIC